MQFSLHMTVLADHGAEHVTQLASACLHKLAQPVMAGNDQRNTLFLLCCQHQAQGKGLGGKLT